MSKAKDFSKDFSLVIYINLAIIVLLLAFFNIQNINEKRQITVLGASTDNSYWEEMVKKHPTYRDAWVELGRMDKVLEIDPNYKP